MNKKLLSLIAGTALLIPTLGQAVGLGSIKTYSSLNQPLSAEIPVLSVRNKNKLSVSLASNAEFSKRGIQRSEVLNDLTFAIFEKSNGRTYIRVNSRKQLTVPYINFILQLNSSEGVVSREYAVFLDPASSKSKEPSIAKSTPPKKAKKVRKKTTKAKKKTYTPKSNLAISNKKGTLYGPIRKGETLWAIASHTRPSQTIKVREMVNAIVSVNPNTLSGNRMPSGVKIFIPTLEGHSAYAGGYAPLPGTKAVAKPNTTKTAQAKAAQEKVAQEKVAKAAQAKAAQAKAAQAKAAQAKAAQAKAAQAKAAQAKAAQAKAAQAKAAQAKAAQAKAAQAKAAQAKAAQAKAAQTEAAQTEAAQTEAAQTEAMPVNPVVNTAEVEQAKKIAEAKAIQAKKVAEAKAYQAKKIAEAKAIQAKKIAEVKAGEAKKLADEKAIQAKKLANEKAIQAKKIANEKVEQAKAASIAAAEKSKNLMDKLPLIGGGVGVLALIGGLIYTRKKRGLKADKTNQVVLHDMSDIDGEEASDTVDSLATPESVNSLTLDNEDDINETISNMVDLGDDFDLDEKIDLDDELDLNDIANLDTGEDDTLSLDFELDSNLMEITDNNEANLDLDIDESPLDISETIDNSLDLITEDIDDGMLDIDTIDLADDDDSAIDLNEGDKEATTSPISAEVSEENESRIQMKLDLANSFISISEEERAKELLQEVVVEGTQTQIEKAKKLLSEFS